MNFIIDTSILIEIENDNKRILEEIAMLKETPLSDLGITFFSFCEFYFGAMEKSEKNKEKVLERLSQYSLLNTTKRTGILFCETLYQLKKKGKLIPHFDILIASLAIEHDMTLIATDPHFNEIPHLKKVILDI